MAKYLNQLSATIAASQGVGSYAGAAGISAVAGASSFANPLLQQVFINFIS